MWLKKSFAVAVTIGAAAVGSLALIQSAHASAYVDNGSQGRLSNDPWQYYGEFSKYQDCESFGEWRVAAHAWKQFACNPAGDSWDLVYIPESR